MNPLPRIHGTRSTKFIQGPRSATPARLSHSAVSSPRCAVAQSRLAGDVYPRTDVQLAQDVGDVGRDGPGGQEQPGGDLRVGQSLRDESGDLGFGRREAVPAVTHLPVLRARAAADAMRPEPGLEPGDIPGGPERGIEIDRAGERSPRPVAFTRVDEGARGPLQRLGAQQWPAGVAIA